MRHVTLQRVVVAWLLSGWNFLDVKRIIESLREAEYSYSRLNQRRNKTLISFDTYNIALSQKLPKKSSFKDNKYSYFFLFSLSIHSLSLNQLIFSFKWFPFLMISLLPSPIPFHRNMRTKNMHKTNSDVITHFFILMLYG